MTTKKPATKKKVVEQTTPVEQEELKIANPCNAWAFILSPSFNAFCPLEKGHEDDHQITINIFAEPQSHFNIAWGLDD
jgi:hypothetical protein